MSKLLIIRGIPGTGKSTKAKRLIEGKHYELHIEADMYHIDEHGEYKFDFNRLADAHSWCLRHTKEALNEGKDVIVANTFTTYKEMNWYVKFAIENDHEILVHSLTEEYGSIHGVPADVMEKMRNRFQPHQLILMEIDHERAV